MTENEKNLALGSAKAKVDKLIDWYYIKRSPLLKDFDKEALLGKITFDLLELRGILDGCTYNSFDEQAKATDAFIEKACEWIEDHIYDYLKMNRTWNEPDYEPKLIEDFRKAMKGE